MNLCQRFCASVLKCFRQSEEPAVKQHATISFFSYYHKLYFTDIFVETVQDSMETPKALFMGAEPEAEKMNSPKQQMTQFLMLIIYNCCFFTLMNQLPGAAALTVNPSALFFWGTCHLKKKQQKPKN